MDKALKTQSISTKALGFSAKEIRKLVETNKGGVFLQRIAGVATSFFTGVSKNGDYIGFRGSFMAVNNKGEIFESSTGFFPANISNPLYDQIQNGASEVEIKADIFAIESDKNASGYAYMCEPVLSDSGAEKMNKLKSVLSRDLNQLLIAAPETKEEKPAKK